jgi:hypothetical protein
MKKQINEIKRMQQLAGILKENKETKKYSLKVIEPDQTTDKKYGVIINNKYCSDNVNDNSYEPFEWYIDINNNEKNYSIIIKIVGKSFETWEHEEEEEYLNNEWDEYVEENKGNFLEEIAYKTKTDYYNPISISYYLIKDH